jgi:hypothetical protein
MAHSSPNLHREPGQYNRAFCRELGAILSEYSRDVLDLGSLPDREVPISELEVKLSRVCATTLIPPFHLAKRS